MSEIAQHKEYEQSSPQTRRAKWALVGLSAAVLAGVGALIGIDVSQHPDLFTNITNALTATVQKIGDGLGGWLKDFRNSGFARSTGTTAHNIVDNVGVTFHDATDEAGKLAGQAGESVHNIVDPTVQGFNNAWNDEVTRRAVLVTGGAGLIAGGAGLIAGHKLGEKSNK